MNNNTSSKSVRCGVCKKKLGIMAHMCKCERVFCISHLHAEEHQCTYSYKESERKELERQTIVGPLSDKMTDRI
jgi:hypothetical protein